MKHLLLTLFTAVTLLAALPASADGRNGRGWDRHYDRGWQGGNRHNSHNYSRNYSRNYYYPQNRYYGNYRSNWYSGYSWPYSNYGSHLSISFGSHGHRHHDDFSTGSFLGGLVIGSVLSAPRHYDNHVSYRQPVVNRSSVTVINRSPVNNQPVFSGRRLLRDLQGRCYEINTDSNGNETRVELDPSACNF